MSVNPPAAALSGKLRALAGIAFPEINGALGKTLRDAANELDAQAKRIDAVLRLCDAAEHFDPEVRNVTSSIRAALQQPPDAEPRKGGDDIELHLQHNDGNAKLPSARSAVVGEPGEGVPAPILTAALRTYKSAYEDGAFAGVHVPNEYKLHEMAMEAALKAVLEPRERVTDAICGCELQSSGPGFQLAVCQKPLGHATHADGTITWEAALSDGGKG